MYVQLGMIETLVNLGKLVMYLVLVSDDFSISDLNFWGVCLRTYVQLQEKDKDEDELTYA